MPYKDERVRKAKQKEYSRTWYQNNRTDAIKKSKINKDRAKKDWFAYKAAQKCSYCFAQHPAIIDFHHVIKEGKRSVNELALKQNNIREAIKEAKEKCIPLCSNCHRIYHWDEHQRRRKRRKK